MYGLYGALLLLAWAAVLPYQIVIPLLSGGPRPRLKERLGLLDDGARPSPGGFWIHAVSVGEVRLALSLLARLRERFADRPVHLTTNTATGRALAENEAGPGGRARPDTVSELPVDLPGPMSRLLDRVRPGAVLIMETEIWPNLLRLCRQGRVPVILVNGRISPRAYPRYRAVRRFMAGVLTDVSLFGMQSEEDAERIRSLGAPEDRIRVTGNLKFDLPPPRVSPGETRRRLGIPDDACLFVAGSTAPGEEAPVLEAFGALRRLRGSARLVLAPRHPQRFAEAHSALRTAGLRVAIWSDLGAAPEAGRGHEAFEALLVDSVGVLPDLYESADLVFVGGSLVPRGGHNILEPAALGKPVLFGPHMENFRRAAQALVDAGGGFVARDGRELGALVARLASDGAARSVAGTMARRVVEANRGATERTLTLIEEALGARPRERHGRAART